jgi:hypothetical protein
MPDAAPVEMAVFPVKFMKTPPFSFSITPEKGDDNGENNTVCHIRHKRKKFI